MKKKFKITFNSPVILTFCAICIVSLAVSAITGGASNMEFFMTYNSGLDNPMTYLRLFTHVFGHANIEHLMNNLTYILLLGPMLEEKYGGKIICVIIALTAVTTGLANMLFFPGSALLGASGVVFAFIILSSITGIKDGEIPLTFILIFVFYIGAQIYQGLFVADNVANFAHIIGGIVGAAVGFTLVNRKQDTVY